MHEFVVKKLMIINYDNFRFVRFWKDKFPDLVVEILS
jgi:hypothetical protein